MNEIEDRLRDAFHADVQAVSPESLRGLPAPATRTRRLRADRHRRMLAPLAAAAASAAIIVAVTTLSPLGTGNGPGASLPGGMPRFYVIGSFWFKQLVIRSTATGQVTGTVPIPRGQQAMEVAPLAGDDSFIALVQSRKGSAAGRLEQFSISSNGQPSALHPLNITSPGRIAQFAVTPDGHTIVFYLRHRVEVVNRLTGQTRTWTGCCQSLGYFPSLSASGRLLAFLAGLPNGNTDVRLLPTTTTPGPVTKRSRRVLPDADWATLSPSGSTLYACLAPRMGLTIWISYAVATGQRRTIARWRGPLYGASGCSQDVASASGRYVLAFPNGQNPRALDTRTGRTIPLPNLHISGSPFW
jgi:hypothetical protein